MKLFKHLLLSAFLLFSIFSIGQSTTKSFASTLPFRSTDQLQIFNSVGFLSSSSFTGTPSTISFTSSLAFSSTDALQIYNALRILGTSSAFTSTPWSVRGNSITTGDFLGTTNAQNLIFKTNNTTRFTISDLGFTTFTSTGLPASGEPNEFQGATNGTLVANNYLLRSSFNFSSTVNNVNYRLGAMLGVMDITAAHTGTLGWAVGQYGVAYNHGSGNSVVSRNIGGYFVSANRSTGNATTTALYGGYFQTEFQSGYTENGYGAFIPSPIVGTGTCNTSFGLYIGTHSVAVINYPLYVAGANGISNFEGKVQTSILSVTTITNNFAVNGIPTFSNGIFIKQKSADGTARDLIGLDAGDNIYITGKQASSDVYINNSSTKFFSIKAAGRVGIFGTAATALLHIGTAGSGASSNGALKFTVPGATVLTTPEQGVAEPDANGKLYYTPVSSRFEFGLILINTATLDFPSTIATAVSDLTLTVTGAALNDPVQIGVPNGAITATSTYWGWVSAANVVTVRFSPKGTEDPVSGTFKATVIKN